VLNKKKKRDFFKKKRGVNNKNFWGGGGGGGVEHDFLGRHAMKRKKPSILLKLQEPDNSRQKFDAQI